MEKIARFFPVWAFSSICVVVGFMNGVSFAQAIPPDTRAEAWGRFYAQVDWYAMALIIFWVQLILWSFVWRTNDRRWFVGLWVAFFASGIAFAVAVRDCFNGDELIP